MKKTKMSSKAANILKMLSQVLLRVTGEEQVLTRTELQLTVDLHRNLQVLISKRFEACEVFMSSICIDYFGTAILNNMLFWQLQSLKGAFCRNDSDKAYHSDIQPQEEFLVVIPTFRKNVVCLDWVPRQVLGALRAETVNIDKAGLTRTGSSRLCPVSICYWLLLCYIL